MERDRKMSPQIHPKIVSMPMPIKSMWFDNDFCVCVSMQLMTKDATYLELLSQMCEVALKVFETKAILVCICTVSTTCRQTHVVSNHRKIEMNQKRNL